VSALASHTEYDRAPKALGLRPIEDSTPAGTLVVVVRDNLGLTLSRTREAPRPLGGDWIVPLVGEAGGYDVRRVWFAPAKCLSVRQPWVWMITEGGKDVENRKWNTHGRGAFLLHASKGMTEDEYLSAILFAHGQCTTLASIPEMAALPRGGICGIARWCTGVIPPGAFCVDGTSWHMGEQYGFQIAGAQPLPLVPCEGYFGFFPVPESILR